MGFIRGVIPFIPVPKPAQPAVNFILLVGTFCLTVYAIFRAMSQTPKPKPALAFLLYGILIQVLAIFVLAPLAGKSGLGSIVTGVFNSTGLMVWCIGLGALIASMLREKNILIPVGMFLIGYDMFLVLAPKGFVQQSLKADPSTFQKMALTIPKASETSQSVANAVASTAAYVGPADLVFLGAFFLAMFRFDMKPKETLKWMIPALILYMILVIFTGWNLPALVPIGLVTLLVNYKEFKLSKDEWASTLVLLVLMAGILGFLATRKPKPPIAPSLSEASAMYSEQGATPGPGGPNQPQLPGPSDGQSKPSLR